MPSVLFVCTGNICRSPMAGALFRRLIRPEKSAVDWRIETAGTWATEGHPASKNAQVVMSTRGLDLRGHRSRPVTREMLASFNLILTMEAGHKEALQVEFPEIADRVYMLSEMVGKTENVSDPIGKSYEEYEEAAQLIDRYLTDGFKKIITLSENDRKS